MTHEIVRLPDRTRSKAPTVSLELVLGSPALLLDAASAAGRRLRPVAGPVLGLALDPPLVSASLRPGTWLRYARTRSVRRGSVVLRGLASLLDELVPVLLEEVLRRTDLTGIVQQHVDVDRIVAGVDLDAVAARLDVDAVAARIDVEALLDRLDLTEVVMTRVDLGTLVQAVLARVDLAALAAGVIDELDLTEIIRASTGSMASDSVRLTRMQGIAADEAVARLRTRLRSGRKRP